MKPIGSITLLCALAALAYGCDSDQPLTGPGVAKPSPAAAGVPSTEGLASPEWQQLARNFIMQSALSGNSTKATRVYAYLSVAQRSEEHTSELQSPCNLVCRLLLEKKKKNKKADRVLTGQRKRH